MSTTLDRPPDAPRPPRQSRHSDVRTASQPPVAPPSPPVRKKRWIGRYKSHLLIAGLSIVVTAIALSPLILGATSRSTQSSAQAPVRTTAVAPTNLATNVAINASEFKFSPSSIQVPVAQKVTFTFNNTGVVLHDFTVPNTGFSVSANPGQRSEEHTSELQ